MKLKNLLRAAVIGGIGYLLYKECIEKEGPGLIDGLRKDIKEDIEGLKEDITEAVGLPNPYRELGYESFRQASGLDIDLYALEDPSVKAYSLDVIPAVYGVKLKDSDELPYDLRFTEKSNEKDISGMYYEWKEVVEYPKDAPECVVSLSAEGQGVCSWEDEERKYTLSMTEGASLVKLVWMRKRLLGLISR